MNNFSKSTENNYKFNLLALCIQYQYLYTVVRGVARFLPGVTAYLHEMFETTLYECEFQKKLFCLWMDFRGVFSKRQGVLKK